MIVCSKPIFQRYPIDRKIIFSRYNEERQFFYLNGRVSLLHALRKIGMKAGDVIGVPAYFCESGVEAATANGFKCVFYDISKRAGLSLEKLQELVVTKHVTAILLVHYFGFQQANTESILDFARDKNLRVIEDYCHSFLSYRSRNHKIARSDAYTFSYRKTLAGINVGALILGDQQGKSHYRLNSGKGSKIDLSDNWFSWIERLIIGRGLLNPYGEYIDRIKSMIQHHIEFLQHRKVNIDEVQLSDNVLGIISNNDYLNLISDQRRQNYLRLSSIFTDAEFDLLFPVLKKWAVPQTLPVLDTSQKLLPLLRANGIGAYKWPGDEIPKIVHGNKNLFPNAVSINENIVCVPVHQDLDEQHFLYIRNILMR